jgi:hypothetical protein
MQPPAYQTDADVMKRIATPMIGGVVTSRFWNCLSIPSFDPIWRKRQLGFMNKPNRKRAHWESWADYFFGTCLALAASFFF